MQVADVKQKRVDFTKKKNFNERLCNDHFSVLNTKQEQSPNFMLSFSSCLGSSYHMDGAGWQLEQMRETHKANWEHMVPHYKKLKWREQESDRR